MRSSDPDNPVRIVKLGGTVSVIQNRSGSGISHTWQMDNESGGVTDGTENVIVDGFLPDGTNGIKVQAINTGAQLVMIRKKYTGVQLTGMTFNQDITNNDSAGSNVTYSAIATADVNESNHVDRNSGLFRCHMTKSNQEGAYINHNNDHDTGSGGYLYTKSVGFFISRCLIENSGRDGIQPGACNDLEVNDNTILTWGTLQHQNHESAISYNAGNSGIVHYNYCKGGKMLLNIQSGLKPYNVVDGETTPQPSYFLSNVFINGTYAAGGVTEPDAVYIQNMQDAGDIGEWEVNIISNTFITDKAFAEGYGHTSSFPYTINAYNNIIVSDTPGITTAGAGTAPTRNINNLTKDEADIADLLFTDAGNGDYTLSSFSSPAYSGSPTNLIEEFIELKDVFNDFSGYPLLAPGRNFTFGAYSGYEKRENDPTSIDAVTFNILRVEASGSNDFTFGSQTNQRGWLYNVVTSRSEANPTDNQILSGSNFAGVNATSSFVMFMSSSLVTHSIVGLLQQTSYSVHSLFVSPYGVNTRGTKVNVNTEGDASGPIISNFRISSLNRSRILFNSNENITGSNTTGFSLSSGKTISSLTITNGVSSSGYLTVNSPYTMSSTENITYVGGSNIEDTNNNSLQTFGSTSVINNITSNAEQDVTQGIIQAGSFVGNDFTGTGDNPGGMKTVQGIPSGSNGYIEFQWDDPDGHEIGCGLINGATNYTYGFSQVNSLIVFDANSNMSVYQLGTFKDFQGALQVTSNYFRVRRVGSTGQVITEYSLNGSSWSEFFNHGNIAAALNLYGAVQSDSTTSGRQILNIRMQCDDGLIVDSE